MIITHNSRISDVGEVELILRKGKFNSSIREGEEMDGI